MPISRLSVLFMIFTLLVACQANPTPTAEPSPSPSPSPDPADAATLETTAEPPPEETPTPELRAEQYAPQTIEFQAADGAPLVGTYFPASQPNAPGVVLVHMLNDDRQVWFENSFAAILQNVAFGGGIARTDSYAVLTVDLRGHGESGGQRSRPDYPQDVAAAVETLRALEGVDGERIALIGASIGADSVAAACAEGCRTVVSLSPGGFTGTPYADLVASLAQEVAVLCVAAEDDGSTAEACRTAQEVAPGPYVTRIYEGRAHGTDLFSIDQEPPLELLLLEWLDGQLTE